MKNKLKPIILYPKIPDENVNFNYMSKRFYTDLSNDNKSFKLSLIKSLEIQSFRTFKNQELTFGDYITVIVGQNGSMKSTLMGLAVHPFDTDKNDINGLKMSTDMRNVFNWSNAKDIDKYHYYIRMKLSSGQLLKEPVEIVPDPIQSPKRHRVTVSGHAKGDGQMVLPVTYLNLKRLFPLVDMHKNQIWDEKSQNLTTEEKLFISDFYYNILQRKDFNEFASYDALTGRYHKIAKGPSGNNSSYDANTISSGEDNLGIIVDQLISFIRIYNNKNKYQQKNELTGILTIDEIEASLHPSSQRQLFEFLFKFSQNFKVQIIMTTHSLSLITDIMNGKGKQINRGLININFVTSYSGTPKIIKNPNYKIAYRELTLRDEIINPLKIQVRLEDKVAEAFFKNLINDDLKKMMTFSTKVDVKEDDGTSFTDLEKIAISYPKLFLETNSLIVFDADVPTKITKKVEGQFKNYIKLPSLDVNTVTGAGLPIEKEIVFWVGGLKPDDKLFTLVNKTQQMFASDWVSYGIQANRAHFHDLSTNPFKNWAKANPSLFNRLMIEYSKRAKLNHTSFYENLNSKINRMISHYGLPAVE